MSFQDWQFDRRQRVVLPMIGDGINEAAKVARMGNFHKVAACSAESWVTVGETLPGDWLRADLAETARPTIVFAHQRLDVGSPYGVKNAPQVRQILEESKKVLAVFQGHSHKNDYHEIGGIHYCTLVALVEGSGIENNGYAIAELDEAGTIQVHGFRRQTTYNWHG